eukprot:scaffold83293_cov90-Phaeocystis_antarctica.AAC.3
MDVPGLTKHDVKLSRQNVTTIIKGGRSAPYAELQARSSADYRPTTALYACTLSASVQVVVEKAERKYGEFTQTFKIPQASSKKVAKSVDRHHAPRLARYTVLTHSVTYLLTARRNTSASGPSASCPMVCSSWCSSRTTTRRGCRWTMRQVRMRRPTNESSHGFV